MNLRHLRYLRLIVQEGSFSAAARVMGVSQPAVTQAMKALERELGTPLFEGLGQHKKPTRAALLAAQRAGTLEANVASIVLATESRRMPHAEAIAPRIRIGMSPVAAQLYSTLVASTWHKDSQRGPIQLTSGGAPDLLRALQRSELDLVITPRPRAFPLQGLEASFLCSSTPTIYARTGHPLSAARSLIDLKDVGWVIVGQESAPGDMIDEALRVRRLPRASVLAQCDNYATCLRLIAESDMMCVVPHRILVDSHQSRVRPLHIREGLPQYDICMFKPPSTAPCPTPGVDEIVEALLWTANAAATDGRAMGDRA